MAGSCPSASGPHLVLPITNVTKRMFISRLPSEWKTAPIDRLFGLPAASQCLAPSALTKKAVFPNTPSPQLQGRTAYLSCSVTIRRLGSVQSSPGRPPKTAPQSLAQMIKWHFPLLTVRHLQGRNLKMPLGPIESLCRNQAFGKRGPDSYTGNCVELY